MYQVLKIMEKSLYKDGYQILNIKNPELLSNLLLKHLKKNKINSIGDLRRIKNDIFLNKIKSSLVENLSECALNLLSKELQIINKNKNKYLLQRYPHVTINVGKSIFSKTLPHCDIFAGHSPYTYTIWIPMHDVEKDSGIFLMSLKNSLKIIDNFDLRNKKTLKFIKKKSNFININFGQCIIFSAFNFHGSEKNKHNLSRVAINFRFQSPNKPILERDLFFFKIHKL